ncbi:hypothetical protein [Pseudoalteromonas mariniglutinosa]|uniref:hypothetical protein n=1 Tax=Pseudoalteromonas mariniglutinosa TaxID=206042 RepID=UPI00384F133E
MDKENLPSEEFRTPENILQPDVRTEMMGVQSIEQFYENIKSYQLGQHVDEKIRVQFDTIKNLYLHAYFVYRFFPIVSHQLYVTLEHALRECIGEKKLDDFRKSKNKQLPKKGPKLSRGLKLCMTYIVENELIKNEDFSAWQRGKKQRAEEVYSRKISEIIDSKNLDSYEWNEDEIDYENVVYEYDYLEVVMESAAGIRNSLAHGSPMLSPTPIIEFDITSTIINKVYERFKG